MRLGRAARLNTLRAPRLPARGALADVRRMPLATALTPLAARGLLARDDTPTVEDAALELRRCDPRRTGRVALASPVLSGDATEGARRVQATADTPQRYERETFESSSLLRREK